MKFRRMSAFLLLLLPCLGTWSAADEPAPAASAMPTVKLLNAGTGPMATLRLVPNKGDKQSVVMTMTMDMEMSVGGMAQPSVKLPPMLMTLDIEVTEVTADRDVRYVFHLSQTDVGEDPAVMAEVSAMVKAQLQQAVGMKGKVLITDRGLTKEADLEFPPGLDPQTRQMLQGMKQSLNQLSAPLPEEAVGQGASWEVSTTLSENGLTLKQVATYTVAEIGDGACTAKIALRQKGDPQEMKAPGLPPGTKVHLQDMTSEGEGEVRLVMKSLAPPKSSLQMKTSMKSMIEAMGQQSPMSMKMGMGIQIESK